MPTKRERTQWDLSVFITLFIKKSRKIRRAFLVSRKRYILISKPVERIEDQMEEDAAAEPSHIQSEWGNELGALMRCILGICFPIQFVVLIIWCLSDLNVGLIYVQWNRVPIHRNLLLVSLISRISISFLQCMIMILVGVLCLLEMTLIDWCLGHHDNCAMIRSD